MYRRLEPLAATTLDTALHREQPFPAVDDALVEHGMRILAGIQEARQGGDGPGSGDLRHRRFDTSSMLDELVPEFFIQPIRQLDLARARLVN